MGKHNFKKKFGQNFLNNDEILERISSSFVCEKEGKILEIGPGAGALTKKLVKYNNEVIAFEIDTELKERLDKIKADNLKIIYKDFLGVNLNDYYKKDDILYVVANIPYYITTPIITKFIDEKIIPKEMILMVQKEVGLRLSATAGTRENGAITVILNYFFDIEYLFSVDRNNFYPIPNVDSAIIKLTKKNTFLNCNYEKFKKLVNDSFGQKRKNLRNNLKHYDLGAIEEILKKHNFSLNNRAEEINYEIFVEISNVL